jgi:hypothetical protein
MADQRQSTVVVTPAQGVTAIQAFQGSPTRLLLDGKPSAPLESLARLSAV